MRDRRDAWRSQVEAITPAQLTAPHHPYSKWLDALELDLELVKTYSHN
ncbi:hypothetical protein HGO38_18930 [Rhizobium sp. CG5]|nr:hypothetical protein [Rhizobium sp. CG5]MCM2475556.1 hypothetical protein [Rhizobium sp. CG5]